MSNPTSERPWANPGTNRFSADSLKLDCRRFPPRFGSTPPSISALFQPCSVHPCPWCSGMSETGSKHSFSAVEILKSHNLGWLIGDTGLVTPSVQLKSGPKPFLLLRLQLRPSGPLRRGNAGTTRSTDLARGLLDRHHRCPLDLCPSRLRSCPDFRSTRCTHRPPLLRGWSCWGSWGRSR